MNVELNFSSDVNKLFTGLETIETKMGAIQNANTSVNKSIQDESKKTAASVNNVNQNIAATGTALSKGNAVINQMTSANKNLDVSLKTLQGDLQRNKQLYAETSAKWGADSKLATVYADAIKEINQKIDDMQPPPKVVEEGFESLRKKLLIARTEAQQLSQEFGLNSEQAVAAQKRVADLADEIGDFNARIEALNPDKKFAVVGQLAQGIAGGFAAAQGALALFGAESEDIQKALLKVQAALALSQGINSVLEMKDTFKSLAAVLGLTTAATNVQSTANVTQGTTATGAAIAMRGLTAAMLANPFTAILVALTAVISALVIFGDTADSTADRVKSLSEENDKLSESLSSSSALVVEQLNKETDLLESRGATEQELNDARQKAIEQQIRNEQNLLDINDKQMALQREVINDFRSSDDDIEAARKKLGELIILNSEHVIKIGLLKADAEIENNKFNKREVDAEKEKNDKLIDETKTKNEELRALRKQFQDEEFEAVKTLEGELIALRKQLHEKTTAVDIDAMTEQQKIAFEGNKKLAEIEENFAQLQAKFAEEQLARRKALKNNTFLPVETISQSDIEKAANETVIAILKLDQQVKEKLKAAQGGEQIPINFQPRLVPGDPSKDGTKEVAETLSERLQQELETMGKTGKFSIANVLFPFNSNEDKALIDKNLAGIADSISSIVGSIVSDMQRQVDAQIEANQKIVDSLNDRINETQTALEDEQKRQEKGYANNVAAKQKELAALKAQRDAELAHQQSLLAKKQKIAREVAIADSIASGAKIVLAAAETIEAAVKEGGVVGAILGIAAAAALVAGFFSIKANVEKSQSLGEGGTVPHGVVKGKKHRPGVRASGIRVGDSNLWIEGGEFLNKASVSEKYYNLLDDINNEQLTGHGYKDLRKLLNESGVSMSDDLIAQAVKRKDEMRNYEVLFAGTSHPGTEKRLDAINNTLVDIKRQSVVEQKVDYKPDGTKVVTRGSVTYIINP